MTNVSTSAQFILNSAYVQAGSNLDSSHNIAKEIILYFKENMFYESGFFSGQIPKIFKKISASIQEDNYENTNQIIFHIHKLIKYRTYLCKPSIQIEIRNIEGIDSDFLQKSFQAIYYFDKYIEPLYEIEIGDDGSVIKCAIRKLELNDLINCVETTKALLQVKNGLRQGFEEKTQSLERKNLFSTRNSEALSIEVKTARNNNFLLTKNTAGVLLFSAGSAGISLAEHPSIISSPLNSGLELAGSSFFMTAGFRLLAPLCSSNSKNYEYELQQMHLMDICKIYCQQDNSEDRNLTHQIYNEIKKLLPKNLNFAALGLEKIISTNENIKFTSADATAFVESLLNNDFNLTYDDICKKINDFYGENFNSSLEFLYKNTIQYKENTWRTLLEHLYIKLDGQGKLKLLKDLKNGDRLFGIRNTRKNPINALFIIAKNKLRMAFNSNTQSPRTLHMTSPDNLNSIDASVDVGNGNLDPSPITDEQQYSQLATEHRLFEPIQIINSSSFPISAENLDIPTGFEGDSPKILRESLREVDEQLFRLHSTMKIEEKNELRNTKFNILRELQKKDTLTSLEEANFIALNDLYKAFSQHSSTPAINESTGALYPSNINTQTQRLAAIPIKDESIEEAPFVQRTMPNSPLSSAFSESNVVEDPTENLQCFSLNEDDKLGIAIKYVYEIIRTTCWEDRIEGTQQFSNLMMDIYSSDLSSKDQLFLIKRLSESLAEHYHGEFAKGKNNRENARSYNLKTLLYTTTSAGILGLCWFLPGSILAITIAKLISSGIGSVVLAIGFLGLDLQTGSYSHKDKEIQIKKAQNFLQKEEENRSNGIPLGNNTVPSEIKIHTYELVSEVEIANFSLEESYSCFLKYYEKLNLLTKESCQYNKNQEWKNTIETILNLAKFFQNKGISEFVFESNHGTDKCPLFEIVSTILDKKLLKKVSSEGDSLQPQALQYVNELLTILYKNKVYAKIEKMFEKNNLNELTEDDFSIFMSENALRVKNKPSKEKLLSCLECTVLLNLMEENYKSLPLTADKIKYGDIYKNCKEFCFKTIKYAGQDESSLFHDLQKYDPDTIPSEKKLIHFFTKFLTTSAITFLLSLSAFPAASPFGLLGIGVLLGFACGAHFAFFNFFKRPGISTRQKFMGKVFMKAHRNYETILSIVEANGELIAETVRPTAAQVIKNIGKENFWTEELMIGELQKCYLPWEKSIDQVKILKINSLEYPNNEKFLRKEISQLYRQGIDKESVSRAFIRANLLILSCEEINKNEKIILLGEVAYYGCIMGHFAEILQTKNTTQQNLLKDFTLGFFLCLPQILMPFAELDSLFKADDALLQIAKQFSIHFASTSIAVGGLLQTLNASSMKLTKSIKAALKASKNMLALYTKSQIEREFNNLLWKRELNEEELKKLQEHYQLGQDAKKAILGIHRNKFRISYSQTKSMKNYDSPLLEIK